MRVFMNYSEVRGPYGGLNAFLRTLSEWLQQQNVEVTDRLSGNIDVALLSGLSNNLDLAAVKSIAKTGVPIVHRKLGYRVSGSADMRRVVDGVVWGDKLQIEFTPHVTHTIFQSGYSRDVFAKSGFNGPFTVIYNGVDERIFNTHVRSWWSRRERSRSWWNGREPLRVMISTWSTDPNKGFADYAAIDASLRGVGDVAVALVGRTPPDVRFRYITLLNARRRERLASVLKSAHVLLQLARFETCSNALIEGLNCGLPAIYLDSGANGEIAAPYGVPYDGDWTRALDAIRARYRDAVDRLADNPYRISVVGPKYLDILRQVTAGAVPAAKGAGA